MATYGFRCDLDGSFDVRRPIGTAPATLACPSCGGPSARVITAPMLRRADRGRMAVIDRCEASGSEPAVVSSLPSATSRKRPTSPDPRTRALPRP
ncbi:hypothetical protein GCM10023321_11080 [Pseudonocardia eucalypti]|uniref:Putative regulatory protein FmdB zinc ribbon domain-containing protein n=1 Tax=Pseudonocardia eucalypti TaxID=648755 RepID=A0ABP9PRI6_9PSEU|nr:putative FmdB family regulatory protein [Pseudonocardia eucalypti]